MLWDLDGFKQVNDTADLFIRNASMRKFGALPNARAVHKILGGGWVG